tara:strand:- start:2681 stop:3100 length:420 start_codon:yes stop_codon:yes gene_type:complete
MQDLIGNEALGRFQEKTAVFLYDFGVLGGGTGAKTLTDTDGNAATLPDNAIISSASWDVVTPLASGGSATVALGVATDGAAIIKAATAFDNAAYVAATQIGGLVASKKLTASRAVIATIATAALTAGKFYLYLNYYEGF